MTEFTEVTITNKQLAVDDLEFEPLQPNETMRLAQAMQKEIERRLQAAILLPIREVAARESVVCQECGGVMLHKSACSRMAC